MFANLMVWIDKLRNHAGAPVAEYALELEVYIYGEPLPFLIVPDQTIDFLQGNPMDSTRFPRYSLGSSDEIIRVLNLFNLDLCNNVGLSAQRHDGLTIKDFNPA